MHGDMSLMHIANYINLIVASTMGRREIVSVCVDADVDLAPWFNWLQRRPFRGDRVSDKWSIQKG